MSDPVDRIHEAWMRRVPDVTAAEIKALLPVMGREKDLVRRLVFAYRAGRSDAARTDRR